MADKHAELGHIQSREMGPDQKHSERRSEASAKKNSLLPKGIHTQIQNSILVHVQRPYNSNYNS